MSLFTGLVAGRTANRIPGLSEWKFQQQVFVVQVDRANLHQISQTDATQDNGGTHATPQTQQNRFPLYRPPQGSPNGSKVVPTLWNLAVHSVDDSQAHIK